MSDTFDPDRTRINVSGYMTHTPLGEPDIGYSLGIIDVRGDFRCLSTDDLRRMADALDAKSSATKEQPPPKSEAEKLVELANSLPQEVLDDAAVAGSFAVNGDNIRYLYCATEWLMRDFERWLLGIMSEYVGSEPGAWVRNTDGGTRWTDCYAEEIHSAPDWLTAHRDCCLAIHANRKEAGR